MLPAGGGGTIFDSQRDFLLARQDRDSWGPMLQALRYQLQHPGEDLYRAIFFDAHIKFQYPPASLLPLLACLRIGLTGEGIFQLLRVASWIAVPLLAVFSLLIASHTRGRLTRSEAAAIFLGCCFFYPVMKANSLGQIQIFLTLGFAAALYCWLCERWVAAGVWIGCMALMKPQWIVVILWFAIRKRWGACFSSMACLAAGSAAAVIAFGWKTSLGYLPALAAMSRQGESYFTNQSVNGTLHRLLRDTSSVRFDLHAFAPYNPGVVVGTWVASAAIVLMALAPKPQGEVSGFAVAAIAATAASPIAWDHHYGILFPIFVWAWFSGLAEKQPAFFAAYLLCGTLWSPLNLSAGLPVANLLQSYVLWGALITAACLRGKSI